MIAPAPTCARCLDRGHVFAARGDRAAAEVCLCRSPCPLCGGSGRVVRDRDGALHASPCSCRDLARRVALYNAAGVPRHFCEKGLSTFRAYDAGQADVLARVQGFAQSYPLSRKGFCLWGKPGTGKTHLLCATLQHLTLEKGVACRFVEISFLFSEIKEAFNRNVSALAALAPLADVEVLAIDEIGKGRGTEWELATLDELLGRRYNADRTTLFSTNCGVSLRAERAAPAGFGDPAALARGQLAEDDLQRRIGDRSFSRMAEMAVFHHLVADDRRIPRF